MERRLHACPSYTCSNPVKAWLSYSRSQWYLPAPTVTYEKVPDTEKYICTFTVSTFPDGEEVIVGQGEGRGKKYSKELAAKNALQFIHIRGADVFKKHIEAMNGLILSE